MGRGRWVGAVGAVVLTALLASSCARSISTDEVSAESDMSGARLATSTTVAPSGNGGAGSSRSAASSGSAGEPELAGTAAELINRIIEDPTLAAQLVGADAETLSRLTGLSPSQLTALGITPDTVRALAAILTRLDPGTAALLAGGDASDPRVASAIARLLTGLSPDAASSLAGLDSQAIALLLGAASTVDPAVIDALGAVVAAVDPDGLGRLANDRSSLAIVAVLFAAALQIDPSQLGNLRNLQATEPGLRAAIDGIAALAASLTPQAVITINQIRERLTPEVLDLLGGLVAALGDPEISKIIADAAADPVVVATTLGVAGLLIPGLAETLDPNLVGADPRARYTALLGLIALAAANQNSLDISALLAALAALGFG